MRAKHPFNRAIIENSRNVHALFKSSHRSHHGEKIHGVSGIWANFASFRAWPQLRHDLIL